MHDPDTFRIIGQLNNRKDSDLASTCKLKCLSVWLLQYISPILFELKTHFSPKAEVPVPLLHKEAGNRYHYHIYDAVGKEKEKQSTYDYGREDIHHLRNNKRLLHLLSCKGGGQQWKEKEIEKPQVAGFDWDGKWLYRMKKSDSEDRVEFLIKEEIFLKIMNILPGNDAGGFDEDNEGCQGY